MIDEVRVHNRDIQMAPDPHGPSHRYTSDPRVTLSRKAASHLLVAVHDLKHLRRCGMPRQHDAGHGSRSPRDARRAPELTSSGEGPLLAMIGIAGMDPVQAIMTSAANQIADA